MMPAVTAWRSRLSVRLFVILLQSPACPSMSGLELAAQPSLLQLTWSP